MSKKLRSGVAVRVANQKSIPVRYQGRTAFIVDSTTSARGTQQWLVSFGARRATPLALTSRQFSVI